MHKTLLFFYVFYMSLVSSLSAQVDVIGDKEYGRLFDVTYDLHTPNVVYALTNGNHIVRSLDQGLNWEIFYSLPVTQGYVLKDMKLIHDGSVISVVIKDRPSRLILIDIKTKNILHTYHLPNDFDRPDVNTYDISVTNDSHLVINTIYIQEDGVQVEKTFVTYDKGVNWKEIYFSEDHNLTSINRVAFEPGNTNTIYLLRGNGQENIHGGLLKSTDGGNNWTESLAGITLGTLAFDPTNKKSILLGTSIHVVEQEEQVYRSIDGGIHWESMNLQFSNEGQLFNIVNIHFNPYRSNHIVILEENEVLISQDNGQNWTQNFYDQEIANIYYYGLSASFNPFAVNELIVSCDFDILRSVDSGQTLDEVLKNAFGLHTIQTQVYANEGKKQLYYSAQYGYVQKDLITNMEKHFNISPIRNTYGKKPIQFQIDPFTSDRVFTYTSNFMGAQLKVNDLKDNTSITLSANGSSSMKVFTVNPTNSNEIWAVFEYLDLESELERIQFDETGTTQRDIISFPTQEMCSSLVFSSDYILATTSTNVYKTTDNGVTWQVLFSVPNTNFIYKIAQNPLNPKELAIATLLGVYTSMDNGETWTKRNANHVMNIAFSTVNNGVIMATTYDSDYTTFQVNYSLDHGATWSFINPELLNHVTASDISIEFFDKRADLYIASGDMGPVKYVLNFDYLGINQPIAPQSSIIISPNPTTDVVNILSDVDVESVQIYGLNGVAIATYTSSNFSVQHLPNGIYSLVIHLKDHTVVHKKLIKKF